MKLKKHIPIVLFVLAMAALLYTGCKSEEKLTLKFAPAKGAKYLYTMNTVQDIDMEQAGQKITSKNTIDFTYEMVIKEKDADNNTVILTTFKKIKFYNKSGAQEMGYDSEVPVDTSDMFNTLFSKTMGAMLDKTIVITINDKGEVTALTGMQAIFDAMMQNLVADSIPNIDGMIQGMKAQFSDEKFRAAFEENFKILPGKEIKVGDTWETQTSKDVMNMDINSKNKYTLTDIKGDNAIVSVTSDIAIDKTAQEGMGGAMQMNGTQQGTMKIDKATGFATEANLTQDITATMNAMGMEVPMKIKSTITITSKQIK